MSRVGREVKAGQRIASARAQHESVGKARALAPSRYGVDFLDRAGSGPAAHGPVLQAKWIRSAAPRAVHEWHSLIGGHQVVRRRRRDDAHAGRKRGLLPILLEASLAHPFVEELGDLLRAREGSATALAMAAGTRKKPTKLDDITLWFGDKAKSMEYCKKLGSPVFLRFEVKKHPVLRLESDYFTTVPAPWSDITYLNDKDIWVPLGNEVPKDAQREFDINKAEAGEWDDD